jgi:hypothetical protein
VRTTSTLIESPPPFANTNEKRAASFFGQRQSPRRVGPSVVAQERPKMACTQPARLRGCAPAGKACRWPSAMRRDPIVEEVRRNREAVARERGNDVGAIVAAFQREDAAGGIITVSFPPKRLVKRATRRKPESDRRPNKRTEPTRSGSQARASHT